MLILTSRFYSNAIYRYYEVLYHSAREREEKENAMPGGTPAASSGRGGGSKGRSGSPRPPRGDAQGDEYAVKSFEYVQGNFTAWPLSAYQPSRYDPFPARD
jgi:hypothetical protein